MQIFTQKIARVALVGFSVVAFASSLYAADVTLKLGHIANAENSWHKASLKFAEEVKTLSKGTVEVQVFPNDSLGKEMDLINGMRLGTADMTITGESLQNWAPKAALLALPYAFKSMEDMDKAVNGALGAEIKKEVIEKAKVIPLAYFARGPRYLTSKTPVKSVEDVKGLKLRVPNVPVFVQYWRGVGAQPTPMAFGEVFTSLQNGVIDAQENPLALIKSASFFEVQKFVNRTAHVRSWIYLAISERAFTKLNAEQKKAVEEAAKRAQAFEREIMIADEKTLEADLKAKGMTFVDTDQTGFAKSAKDSVLAAAKDEIKPAIQKLYGN